MILNGAEINIIRVENGVIVNVSRATSCNIWTPKYNGQMCVLKTVKNKLFLAHVQVYWGSACEGRLYSTKSFRDPGLFHPLLKTVKHHLASIWGNATISPDYPTSKVGGHDQEEPSRIRGIWGERAKLEKIYLFTRASLEAQRLKLLPAMRETWDRSLGRKDPLKKEMATHSSTLAWRIPWTEERGGLQPTGLQRVEHNWSTLLSYLFITIWWQK